MRTRIKCPDIIVYKAIGEVPYSDQFIAWHLMPATVKLTGAKTTIRGTVFYPASTEDGARQKAFECWERSQDDLDRQEFAAEAMRDRMSKKKAATL